MFYLRHYEFQKGPNVSFDERKNVVYTNIPSTGMDATAGLIKFTIRNFVSIKQSRRIKRVQFVSVWHLCQVEIFLLSDLIKFFFDSIASRFT